MKTIAFDVMGSDFGPQAAVQASLEFVQKNPDFQIILVGDKKEIEKFTKETSQIKILESPNIASSKDGLRQVSKMENSMNSALDLVVEKKADAVLSSGDSGAYLTSALLKVKRLKGILRPAFMPIFPTIVKDKKILVLDVGANLETKVEYLIQWTKLASIFSNKILKVKNPKCALVNIGVEDYKGFDFHKQANEELKQSNANYIGFLEPRNILDGKVDVAVVDGYGGNLILKSMEGAVLALKKVIKESITKTFFRKILALFLKKAFKDAAERLDYRNVGAAWVLGLNGIVVKSHGSNDFKAYLGALEQVKQGINAKVIDVFRETLE